MGPDPDTCGELLRPLSALLGLKHFDSQRAGRSTGHSPGHLPRAAATLLTELARAGESRACDLATSRIVDASVVSRQLAQLEQAGLISRRPDPDDRRVSLLRATVDGEREVVELERRQSQWLCHALRGWGDDDVHRLAGLLETMTADIRQAAQEEGEGTGAHTEEES